MFLLLLPLNTCIRSKFPITAFFRYSLYFSVQQALINTLELYEKRDICRLPSSNNRRIVSNVVEKGCQVAWLPSQAFKVFVFLSIKCQLSAVLSRVIK
jgi:hypothetical protein